MEISSARSVGWEATCACEGEGIAPATVLDPFAGSGTTLEAARKLGRRSIGFDIDAKNIELVDKRLGRQDVLL